MPKPAGKSRTKPRRSQITNHPGRMEIEMARAGGVSLDRISAKFGLKRDTVARHWNSLDPEYRASLIADIPREELIKRAVDESGSLLDHFKLIRNLVEQQLIIAKACGDHHAVANLTRAAMDANREVGRITGEIQRLMPGITVNNTTNVLALMEQPAFHDLERGLIDIATRYPDVKGEIISLVRRLKERPEPAPMIEMERAVA